MNKMGARKRKLYIEVAGCHGPVSVLSGKMKWMKICEKCGTKFIRSSKGEKLCVTCWTKVRMGKRNERGINGKI